MSTDTLYTNWEKYAAAYGADEQVAESIFNQLVKSYQAPYRHYHSLRHIEDLLKSAAEFYDVIPAEVFFATWFHDAVLVAGRKDNEEKSAMLAQNSMLRLNIPQVIISKTVKLIQLTANHFKAEAGDELEKFFLDADLKILGSDEDVYAQYCADVRKEYAKYPNFLYNYGRRKFVKHALATAAIYRTEFFRNKYEQQARKNLLTELKHKS